MFADTEQYGGDGAINYLANVGGGNLIRSQQFVMPMEEAGHERYSRITIQEHI